jgi:hypothetical protein
MPGLLAVNTIKVFLGFLGLEANIKLVHKFHIALRASYASVLRLKLRPDAARRTLSPTFGANVKKPTAHPPLLVTKSKLPNALPPSLPNTLPSFYQKDERILPNFIIRQIFVSPSKKCPLLNHQKDERILPNFIIRQIFVSPSKKCPLLNHLCSDFGQHQESWPWGLGWIFAVLTLPCYTSGRQ